MQQLFDIYFMTDWSAKDEPGPQHKKPDKTKKDNIWIAEGAVEGGKLKVVETYCRTRARAVAHLQERIAHHLKQGKRVFAGFDFAFGFPQGFAKLLTGKNDWQPVWQYLAEHIQDDELNENNRFAVAAQINAAIPGPGPFWGLPRNIEVEHMTSTSPWKGANHLEYKGTTMNRLRHTDAQTKGTQEVWKLYGAGSVGGQTLTGIPAVWRLRKAPGIDAHARIWPFEISMTKKEDLAKKPLVVFAEAFPGAVEATVKDLERNDREAPRDQLQVRAMAMNLHQADSAGKLFEWFFSATNVPTEARKEEAAILQPFDPQAPIPVPPKKTSLVTEDSGNKPDPTPEETPAADPKAEEKQAEAAAREAKKEEKQAAREKAKAEREAKMEARKKEQEAKRAEREKEKEEREKAKAEAKAEREAEKAALKAKREAEKEKKKKEREKEKAKAKEQQKKDREKEKAKREKEKAEKKAAKEKEKAAKKAEKEANKASKGKGKDSGKAKKEGKTKDTEVFASKDKRRSAAKKDKPKPKAKAKPAAKKAATEKPAAKKPAAKKPAAKKPAAKKPAAKKPAAKKAPAKKAPAAKKNPISEAKPDGVNIIEAKMGGPIDPVPPQDVMKELIESSSGSEQE